MRQDALGNGPPGQSGGPIDGGTGADKEGLRILIVEDEPTLRSVIVQVLTLDGHEVTGAACAEEALALFRGNPFPLVITDIVMGHMSGLELLEQIKLLDRVEAGVSRGVGSLVCS